MLATLESVVILEKAEQLANMILQSEIADDYRYCLYKVKNNKETQRKFREFVKNKREYEEVKRFGKYHPDNKKISKEIREVKREMDLDENIAQFRQAENNLQNLLDEVSVLVGHAVSDANKSPFWQSLF